ncbi:MAG: HlyD family efflux transporter periplasmic adaptor subunit [Lachnospiraceae bacterium]|nr:HlyD family efflux transporter periplasmic adaptor subunit [Lachnospiraceae bacterium]
MKTKKKGKKRWIILVIVILAVIAIAVFLRMGKSASSGSSVSSRFSTTTTSTEAAYIGTIRVSTEGSGSIEAADETQAAAEYAFTINRVEVENGDTVEEGDLIATLDRDSIQDQIDLMEQQLSEVNASVSSTDKSGSSSLSAPVSGIVKRIYAKSGDVLSDVVEDDGGVMEISADGRLKVEIESEETLKTGETVTVNFLSYEVEGTVAAREGQSYTITIEDDASYLVDAEATVIDDDDVTIGTGYLKSNHPYLVEAAYGTADEIKVEIGDSVSAGDTLLTRTDYTYNATYLDLLSSRETITEDLKNLNHLYQDPQITAESSGIITDLTISDGMAIQADTVMYTLISTEQFWLKVEIDELDIDGITVGQTATVVFDAFDDEEYEGTVEKISALGTNTGGVTTYTVTISLPGDEKLKTAMSATATIVTEEAEDVLLIPVDAIQTVDGQKYVTVTGDDGSEEAVEVTLGLVNNTVAEVTEGLSEGDLVVTTTQSDFASMLSMMQGSGTGGGE